MRRLLLLLALLIPLPALAQEEDSQLWLQANGSVPLEEDTRFTLETIARFSDDAGGFFHEEIGGLVTHMIGKRFEIAIGYRHVVDFDHGREKPDEERARQQITMTLGSGFGARLRMEERFREGEGEVGLRLRPQIRYTLPLGRGRNAPSLLATHEAFVNFNRTDWGQQRGIERLRQAVSLQVPLGQRLRGDIGYLNQYRFGRDGRRDLLEHAATFALTLTL